MSATGPIYAVGDVHGHLDQLRRVHDLIEADRAGEGLRDASVIHIGDLCDRGPDTRGVIDFLLTGLAAGQPWTILKGNHDRMFARYLEPDAWHDPHLWPGLFWQHPRLGGLETLRSYGVEVDDTVPDRIHGQARQLVPDEHVEFLQTLPLMHRHGDIVFVHAGIRPGVALDEQWQDDLLWIRDEFLDDPRDHGAFVVHGHTMVPGVGHHGNRLNIDTGAGRGDALSVVVLEGRQVWQLTPRGRQPVVPV